MSDKPAAGSIKTFSCPSCGGTIGIRAVGISINAVCGSCGSIVDVANENVALIKKAAVKTAKIPLALGSRATLYGVVWEVIGYSERCDATGEYFWEEYLLFNPYQGFRFLTEADGHWNFVTMLRDDVGLANEDYIYYGPQHYHIFTRGGAKVTYVMGEFYWRVKLGDKALVADYVAPPFILSMESSDGDIVWSRGEYIAAQDIADAFKLPVTKLPRQKGVAPNQPSPFAARLDKCKMPCLIAFSVLMALQILFVSYSRNELIFEQELVANPSDRNQTIITAPLEVPGENGNLAFILSSPVDNQWVELSVSLVNDTTQETEEVTPLVEFYHGYDSDGYWSEGSHYHTSMLSAVPGGKYHLMVEPDAGAFERGSSASFKLQVIRDMPTWGLFLLALCLILAHPLLLLIRHWSFEKKRWSDCDYAPVIYRHHSDNTSSDYSAPDID